MSGTCKALARLETRRLAELVRFLDAARGRDPPAVRRRIRRPGAVRGTSCASLFGDWGPFVADEAVELSERVATGAARARRRAPAIDPGPAPVHMNLARALRTRGAHPDGWRTFRGRTSAWSGREIRAPAMA